jgi:biotin carboxyl carrier protein
MNEFVVRINNTQREVKVVDDQFIKIDNVRYQYTVNELNDSQIVLKINSTFYETALLNKNENEITLLINNITFDVNIKTSLQEKAYQLLSQSRSNVINQTIVKSPMPGMVVKIIKKVGDKIGKGETIMILEAMKMENEIKSIHAGLLSEIFVLEGKPIEKNIPLFKIK